MHDLPAEQGQDDPALEPVDDSLAAALQAQGPNGERALGLLRDTYRILGDGSFEQPGVLAESAIRGAAESLLKLPGSGKEPEGLRSAAQKLLKALSAYRPESRAEVAAAGLDRVRVAAALVRSEIDRGGGYHRRRAVGVAARLSGQSLGAAQENALEPWGELYGQASQVLHGGPSQRARESYRKLLVLAREVFVPLTGRAAQVLELIALSTPGQQDAERIRGWADPRALKYFFLERPSPAWLPLLDDVVLLPDPDAPDGGWPALPYFDHLTEVDPVSVTRWLSSHADEVTAAGAVPTCQYLRLAARPGIGLLPEVRSIVAEIAKTNRHALAGDAAILRMAALWAREIPLSDRTNDWIRTVSDLLICSIRAERQQAERQHARYAATMRRVPESGEDDESTLPEAVRMADETPTEHTPLAGLSGWEVGELLVALLSTAHPDGGAGGASDDLRTIRYVLASALEQCVKDGGDVVHLVHFQLDLGEDEPGGHRSYMGVPLARTVLDLARADALAGVDLAMRTEALRRCVERVDERLGNRLLAAHLDEARPVETDPAWWAEATRLVPALLGQKPTAESARLVEHVFSDAPADLLPESEEAAGRALGAAPSLEELTGYDPSSRPRWPTAWVKAWLWSPVLPARVLEPWEAMLAVFRGEDDVVPADPRVARPFMVMSWGGDEPELDVAQATGIAAQQGPLAAAEAIASAGDAGGMQYRAVIEQLVKHDPAAWASDPRAIITALALPRLQAIYLSALAESARLDRDFRRDTLAIAVEESLALCRLLAARVLADSVDASEEADESEVELTRLALCDLLTVAWRRDVDLADQLPGILDHLYEQSLPLAIPAQTGAGPDFFGTNLAGRALQCLIDHAAIEVPAQGPGLESRLREHIGHLVQSGAHQPQLAAAFGDRLALLHHLDAPWLRAQGSPLLTLRTDTTSAASYWLRWGRPHPPLLADLDRKELLHWVRTGRPEASMHLAIGLLVSPGLLGQPGTVFSELAAGEQGHLAVSRLLADIASQIVGAAREDITANGIELWKAALGCALPPGALAGAGAFAATDIDDNIWLNLTLTSLERTPVLGDPDDIAQRVAELPDHEAAYAIAALLVRHPSADPWRDSTVRERARHLLSVSRGTNGTQLSAARDGLREALILAGDLSAHEL
ncbi:hypothetical protein [Streptomyces sp. NBC_01006]|uniref:hypothetical protein n=1 Tax=Streptomyces sp. NBC_01006 TaxID=2903716 RepID=UPI002F912825|nr:hypothetical protein OG509_42335 [Streptomyces sp. NBC_01006]